MIIKMFNSYEIVGLNVAFSSHPFYVTNFVASKDVEIVSIETKTLLALMNEDYQLMKNILAHISDNSIRIGTRVKNNFKVTIRNQLLSYIKTLQIQQKKNPIIIPISKLKLSEHFDVSRTSISRVFTVLEKEGLIKLNNRYIYVCDLHKK